MSRRPPNSSNAGWVWGTEIVRKNNDYIVCGPAKTETVEPALRESLEGEAGHMPTNQSLPAPVIRSAISTGNRCSSLEQSPETPSSNNSNDHQPPSQVLENGNNQLKMGSGEENYVLASNSRRAVFPGPPIPRSAIPRTVDGLDRSTLLSFLHDTPEEFRDSRIAEMTGESERYQDMVYASRDTRLEPTVPRTRHFQPPPTDTSIKPQNAPAAEHRQDKPRTKSPEQTDKDEDDDQDPSPSDEEHRRGCHQH